MKVSEYIFYAAAAFVLGIGASLMWKEDTEYQKQTKFEEEVRLTAPSSQETAYGEFSLRLLHAAMATQPQGNVLVSPNSTSALLSRLMSLSDGAARQALEALALPESWTSTSAEVRELALIFPDKNIPLCPGREIEPDIIPVPYKLSISDAFVAVNNAVGLYSANKLERTAGSESVSSDTSLMVVNGVVLKAQWVQSVSPDDTTQGDFFNGNGSMPRVPLLCHRGEFRVARAENGDWEAVAFFLRNSAQNADTACMVAVLPRGSSARAFAANTLTPAMLAEIRRALYQAVPEACLIEMPRLIYPAAVQNAHALFSQMGLGCLFMQEAPFPGLSKHSPLHLDCALQQCFVQLSESDRNLKKNEKKEEDLSVALRFDRPFIWFIGNLTAPSPPYLMGIVEDL